MRETGYYSFMSGKLAKGCQLCVKGQKLVLFVTGLCRMNCYYCPISDDKKNKDVIFANERPVRYFKDIKKEIANCSSNGAGITGGDPLMKINRTTSYIRKLKKEYGKKFHIHLYTPLGLANKKNLNKLFNSGLDEIRFHVHPGQKIDPIIEAKRYPWAVGIEIPLIPGKLRETRKIINDVSDHVDFINLNELEYSDTNSQELSKRGYLTAEPSSYRIKGSREMGLKILKQFADKKLNIHFCTTTLKDKVQLGSRIKRQAKNIQLKTDKVSSSGTLIRGAVYLEESVPGFSYRKKVKAIKDSKKKLENLRNLIIKNTSIKELTIDNNKKRILCSTKDLRKINKKILNKCAIVEEYPTYDGFEIELEFLEK